MISFSSGAGQVCGESRGCTTGGAIENKWEWEKWDFAFGFYDTKARQCVQQTVLSLDADKWEEVVKILPTKFLFKLSD